MSTLVSGNSSSTRSTSSETSQAASSRASRSGTLSAVGISSPTLTSTSTLESEGSSTDAVLSESPVATPSQTENSESLPSVGTSPAPTVAAPSRLFSSDVPVTTSENSAGTKSSSLPVRGNFITNSQLAPTESQFLQPDPTPSVFVFTTTLALDLPAQLSTIDLGQPTGNGAGAVTDKDPPASAVSSIASAIVGSPPEGGATATSLSAQIEQLKHRAIFDAIFKWLSSFFHLD